MGPDPHICHELIKGIRQGCERSIIEQLDADIADSRREAAMRSRTTQRTSLSVATILLAPVLPLLVSPQLGREIVAWWPIAYFFVAMFAMRLFMTAKLDEIHERRRLISLTNYRLKMLGLPAVTMGTGYESYLEWLTRRRWPALSFSSLASRWRPQPGKAVAKTQ